MIYEYKVLYDAANVVTGYQYDIITGYDTNSDPILATFILIADGITNDRVALQSLLDEINGQGGGTLLLPAGKELFLDGIQAQPGQSQSSYPLIIYSNIKITSTAKATLIFGEYIKTRMISSPITYGPTTFYPVDNFTLDNLVIKSIDPEPASAMLALRSNLPDYSKNIKILNCDFIGGTQTNRAISFEKVDGVCIDNCTFSNTAAGVRVDDSDGINNNVVVSNCEFKGGINSVHGINVTGITYFCVEKCSFLDGNLGVEINKKNKDVYIRNNVFEPSFTNNPIRVTGSNELDQYTDGLWITGNDIRIQRADQPYLDNPSLEIQRYPDGRVIWTNAYTSLVPKPIGISAINITCAPQEDGSGNIIKDSVHHQNVVVADNIAIGPDYGFYDGGSGDLFSLKDIIRLKCYGNTSRNSGDLGFAIERCHFGLVANNTADRNNSCGISIFDSTHINITGNVCSDNELARDGAYLGNPYGGIRIERSSIGVLVEGNYSYANSGVKRSFVNSLATAPVGPSTFYNQTGSATQRYGVIVKNVWNLIPYNIKVGTNHTSGMLWGNDYTNVKASQMLNTYTGASAPTKGDYPLGTRLRNNLNSSSTAATSEWQVVNHIRMKLVSTSLTGSDTIRVNTLNSQNSEAYKLIENNDFTTILADDVIGIMTDNYGIHWAKVVSVIVSPAIGTNTFDVGEIKFTPALPEDATYTLTTLTIGTGTEDVIDTKDVVCLRWNAL